MISIIQRRRGIAASAPMEGAMQRIDGAYVYELGARLRPITAIKTSDTKRIMLYTIVNPAKIAINEFLSSVYGRHIKTIALSARTLLDLLEDVSVDIYDTETFDLTVSEWDIERLQEQFRSFEAILLAEFQSFPLYLVFAKGGFDVSCLTDKGLDLFPVALASKCPDAVDDVLMGTRSMAFELWTAMAFHFHRANEAVLRHYFFAVLGHHKAPKMLTMGTMVSFMEKNELGDLNIRSALKNIINFHRNPIIHPDHNISDAEEALSLYAAIRASIGYMLEQLTDDVVVAKSIAITPSSALPLIAGLS